MSNTAATDDGDRREGRAAWLTERELDRLGAQAEGLRDHPIVNLGARCRLRIPDTVEAVDRRRSPDSRIRASADGNNRDN